MIKIPSRSIHLVDVENLLADPRPQPSDIETCRARYESIAGLGSGDLIVVGCSHGAAIAVGWKWPSARLVVRSGPDGADLALLEVIEGEEIASRFEHVVIGSGDGIFAEAAAQLAAHGRSVTVVSRAAALSRRLRLAASGVVYFSMPPAPAPRVAAQESA
jgi:hypothetical protein